MIAEKVKKLILKEQFSPGCLGLLVNPFYFARKGLYFHVKSLSFYITGEVLDVGCGQKPYEHLFNCSRYTGLELDTPENRASKNADFFYDGTSFPFVNEQFDALLANQVFEHVFNPAHFIAEIRRVLKPSGVVLITVPFAWDEHEQPFDYARYSSFALKHILESNGFYLIESQKSMADIRAVVQLFTGYLYKVTATKSDFINLLFTIFLISPFNIGGELLSLLLPGNPDFYLDNVIVAKKRKQS